MKITAEILASIQNIVRREAGCQLRPEERFDLGQEVAMRLIKASPDDVDALITTVARNLVNDKLRKERTHREALEHLHTVGSAPSYHCSLKRDPMINYMAIKAVFRGSGDNDVEDALIAAIDARARKRLGPSMVPTCSQNIIARDANLAKRLKHTSRPRAKKV